MDSGISRRMNQPPLRRLAYAMMGSSWWLATAMMGHAAPAAPGQTPPAAAAPAAGKSAATVPGKTDSGKPDAGKADAAKAGDKSASAPPENGAGSEATADAAPPAPIRNPPLRLEIRRNQPLAKQIQQLEGAEGNVVWLGDAKEPFLGLYIENYAKQSLGAVLLLHDNEQHPDWPGMLHELRTSFPQHGWSSLSIALPDLRPIPPILPPLPKPVEAAPTAPAASEGAGDKTADGKPADPKAADKKDAANDKNKDATKDKNNAKDTGKESGKEAGKDKAAAGKSDGKNDNKDPKAAEDKPAESAAPATPPPPEFLQRDSEVAPEKFPAEVERRIREATHYLINEGVQHVVIVAFGNTAGLAAHISRNMLINELDGLVMMDAKPYADARYDLPVDTADLRIPVLDVVPELDPGSNPLLRKQSTSRARTPQYEMRSVAGASSNFYGFEPYVFKTVKGWADTQFRNAPERKDRTQQANKKRAEKAAPPASTAPAAPTQAPATPPGQAPAVPPPPKNGSPAPNLKDPIPPPVP